MKIKDIKACTIKSLSDIGVSSGKSRRRSWWVETEVANPMSKYPKYKRHRGLWMPPWESTLCVVTAEDGTFGVGIGNHSGPVNSIINEHFAPLLLGEDCMAVEKLWDMMFRMASPYSSAGMASYAVSAVDLALWDLKGKLLGVPVYELLGGPSRDKIECYSTGNDTDWYMELGFKSTKLACPYGPADGKEALDKNEELVSETRDMVGPEVELMLDCWMAWDLEFAVRQAERLRPYNLKWIEDCLMPEDFQGFTELKRRLPWQSIATGEHWYTPLPFLHSVSQRSVDYFQPDIQWVGGMTALVKICHIAEAAGVSVIPHAGMNTPYAQHACYAMPGIPLGEFFVGSDPGIPLKEATGTQEFYGMSVPIDGDLVPTDGKGFGIELTLDDIEKWVS